MPLLNLSHADLDGVCMCELVRVYIYIYIYTRLFQAHTTTFVTLVVEHWLERVSSKVPLWGIDPTTHRIHQRTLFDAATPRFYNVKRVNEGNILFNDTLNTYLFTIIWWRSYLLLSMTAVIYDRRSPLRPLHGPVFPINSKGTSICTIPQDNTYHGFCYISCGGKICPKPKINNKEHKKQTYTHTKIYI